MSQLKIPLLGLLILLLQITVVNLLSIQTIKPDLVVIFISARAIAVGPTRGIIWGFAMGFLLDCFSGGTAGLGALAYSMAAFIAGMIGYGKPLAKVSYLSLITVCTVTTLLIFMYFNQPIETTGIGKSFFTMVLPGTAYTFFIALVWIHSPFSHFRVK